MRGLNTIRAMAATIGFCSIGSCALFEKALDCPSASSCVEDQAFHGPFAKQEKYRGSAEIIPVTMYVGHFGWGVVKDKSSELRGVDFDKAYLEINGQGLAFDPGQLTAILERIELLKTKKRPIFVFTYTHGWHQNAEIPLANSRDEDLKSKEEKRKAEETSLEKYNAIKFDYFMARFVEHVRRLYELNGVDNSPIMLGVYVGWRGKSTENEAVNDVNVGNRAATADAIAGARGPGSLRKALGKIAGKVAETGPDSRMIVTGHSLGGRMMSKMLLTEITEKNQYPLGPQTLIAAIEPAISASCYDHIFATGIVGHQGMVPSFIAITSWDDVAVRDGFKWGHLLPLLDPAVCGRYSPARNAAIGDYDGYLTHTWTFKRDGPENDTVAKVGCKPPELSRHPEWLFQEGTTRWQYPFFDLGLPCRNMAGNYSGEAAAYTLAVTQEKAFGLAGAVWNVRVDKGLIDDADDPDSFTLSGIDPRHNGFSSTGLADILGHVAYAQMKWRAAGSETIVPKPTQKP
jgi:hypothetical protein